MITYSADYEAGSQTRSRQQAHDRASRRPTHDQQSLQRYEPGAREWGPVSVEALRGIGCEAQQPALPATCVNEGKHRKHRDAAVAVRGDSLTAAKRRHDEQMTVRQGRELIEQHGHRSDRSPTIRGHDWRRITERESHTKQATIALETTVVHDWRITEGESRTKQTKASAEETSAAVVHDWRRRAEIAEVRATERERIIAVQSKIIDTLEASRHSTTAKTSDTRARRFWPFLARRIGNGMPASG